MSSGPACCNDNFNLQRQLTPRTTSRFLTKAAAVLPLQARFSGRLLRFQVLQSASSAASVSASALVVPVANRILQQQRLQCSVLCGVSGRSPLPTRSYTSAWPVRDRAFQGPFQFTRTWASSASSGSISDDKDSSASRDKVASNSSLNGNASCGAAAPQYDVYCPLPINPLTGAPEVPCTWFGSTLGINGSSSNGDSSEPAALLQRVIVPAITSWPPRQTMTTPASVTAPASLDADMADAAAPAEAVAAAAAAPVSDPFAADLRDVVAAAAAAGGVQVSMDGKGAPAVDVTRHNFEVMLPVVRRYLGACDFFSFDCEMTGLFLEGQTENYLDDMQDRYNRTSMAAQSFVITQFGLSCFRRQEGQGEQGQGRVAGPEDGGGSPGAGETESRYLAATFNFYLFPRPPEGAAAQAASVTSRRFTCDAGSLAFLASQGFDFNRCIYDGVPFMPVRQRDDLLRQVDRDNGSGGNGEGARADVALSKPEDIAFVEGLLSTVRQWLDSGASEPLELPPVNRYLRLLTYQALARPESFGGPAGGGPGWHPGFYVKKVYDERNMTTLRLVRCTSPEEAAALEAADRAERRAGIAAAAGFAAVWEAVRECGRPAVGHNCMFDVAYCISQFGDGRLPATWQGFKSFAAYWFPGGLYDTKHICRQLPEVLGSDTSLGVMYRALMGAGGAADAASAASALGIALPPVAATPRVSISHAPGFEKYVAVAAGQLAHEAGYDAFMTGSVFAALEAVMAEREAAGKAANGPAAAGTSAIAPFASVLQYIWRLNVTRSDLPYALLRPAVPSDPTSLDPVPERPTVVCLYELKWGVRANDIHRRCEAAGLGKVRIAFQHGNHALLELDSVEAATAAVGGALQGAAALSNEVLPYAAFRARKDAMLEAGTWPLPGHYVPRSAPANRGAAAAGAAAAAGGAGAAGAAQPTAPAAAVPAAPGAEEAVPRRAAKRQRVEEPEAEQPQGGAQKGLMQQCAIM